MFQLTHFTLSTKYNNLNTKTGTWQKTYKICKLFYSPSVETSSTTSQGPFPFKHSIASATSRELPTALPMGVFMRVSTARVLTPNPDETFI